MADIKNRFNSSRLNSSFVEAKTKDKFRYNENGVRISKSPIKWSTTSFKSDQKVTIEDIEKER